MCSIKSPHDFNNIIEVAVHFKDESVCLKYIESAIWGDEMKCPFCKCEKIYRFKSGKKFKCSKCRKNFTALVGTIFESTKVHLSKWIMTIYLMGANKKGISACALARQIGVNRKTAWFMMHRIRVGLEDKDIKLSGVVQSDEAFCGGANGNRHTDKKFKYLTGRNYDDKITIHGMIEQGEGGRVKAIVLPKISHRGIRMGVLNTVTPGSVLVSDEYGAYWKVLHHYYEQFRVNHKKKQYKNQEGFSTNSIENFWSHLKNMIRGVYIQISKKHMQKYVNELAFKWNTMKMSTGERLFAILSRLNCRLTYKQLINTE